MKKVGSILGLLLTIGLSAAQLPISLEGQKEADLYLSFLELAFQGKTVEQYCNVYADLIKQIPQDKYLRRQLVLCAL